MAITSKRMRTERLALERLRDELAALREASTACLAELEETEEERRATCEALVARHNALADSVRRVMAARTSEEG